MRIAFSFIVAGLAALALPVWAQSPDHGIVHFPGPGFHTTPVTSGAPYSAEEIRECLQVGSDGTRFTTTGPNETIYRDSEGRMRTEHTSMLGMTTPPGAPWIIEIEDPVAKVSYVLDAQAKVAHRVAWLSPPARAASSPLPAHGTRSQLTTQDLGQREIQGVMAQGNRHVERRPTGTSGSDRPFQIVEESWYSPGLQQAVLHKTSDPRSGESTIQLIHIDRSEPPASLFEAPPDYTVVDETGPFQIEWTAAKQ